MEIPTSANEIVEAKELKEAVGQRKPDDPQQQVMRDTPADSVSKLDALAAQSNELAARSAAQFDKIFTFLQQQDRTKKVESALSENDLTCFPTVLLSWNDLQQQHPPDCLKRIESLVVKYTKNLQSKAVDSGTLAEIAIVQPESRALLTLLYKSLLEQDDLDSVTVDASSLYYRTFLHPNSVEEPFEVTGKADATLLFNQCPILVWKDKNLHEDLSEGKYLAQVLAELKGFAEDFKSRMKREAPLMAGILTSGLTWRFVFRIFKDGDVHFAMTDIARVSSKVCKNKNEIDDCINEDQLPLVASMLFYCINASKFLIEIIKQRSSKLAQWICAPRLDVDDADDDDEADDDHDESDGGKGKKTDPVEEEVRCADKSLYGVQSSSTRKSHKTAKRAPFRTLNEHTLLTRENVYKHNLANDARSLFW